MSTPRVTTSSEFIAAAALIDDPAARNTLLDAARIALGRESVAACTACTLHETRRTAVPWSGRPSPIMLVGEAPGAEEDRAGEPFVGRSGTLLRQLARRAGLRFSGDPSPDPASHESLRPTYALANTVACRPPGNDYNLAVQADAPARCRPHLHRALDDAESWVVVCVGGRALSAMGVHGRIGDHVGRWWWGPDHRLYTAVYHPSYLLRSGSDELLVESTVGGLRRSAEVVSVRATVPPLTEVPWRVVRDMPESRVGSKRSRKFQGERATFDKHWQRHGWVAVHSDAVGEVVVVARDDRVRVPEPWADHPRYTPAELASMRGDGEFLRRVHAAKVALGGRVVVA